MNRGSRDCRRNHSDLDTEMGSGLCLNLGDKLKVPIRLANEPIESTPHS